MQTRTFSLLLLLLICWAGDLFAFEYPLTARSGVCLSRDQYMASVKLAAEDIAREKGMPAAYFEKQYPYIGQALLEYASPLIRARFAEGEKSFPDLKSISREKDYYRSGYEALIGPGVRDAFDQEIVLRGFFLFDNSDRILSFNSVLDIGNNGRITVTETIRVYNGDGDVNTGPTSNDEIKRGIVRDFPTVYFSDYGFRSTTGFELLSVKKNGAEEPYVSESLENGTRIKAGRADVLLEPGIYTYEFVYRTRRQLIHHPDKDECYWNVNGN